MAISFDYSGHTVLVTGGTQGIGHGIATAFADANAVVHVTGTRASADDYPNDLSRFRYHQLRIEEAGDREALAAAIGALDILVNNAGAAGEDEYTLEGYERILAVNLTGMVDLSYRFRPHLAESRGAIVNIASLAGFIGLRDKPAYTASKHGVIGFTKSIADMWARDGIRVNAVAPGFVETQITQWALSDEKRKKDFLRQIPSRRIGLPSEIATAVLFLAAPAASYIVGHTLTVDGGYLLR